MYTFTSRHVRNDTNGSDQPSKRISDRFAFNDRSINEFPRFVIEEATSKTEPSCTMVDSGTTGESLSPVGSVGQIRSGLPGHSSARPSVLSFPPSSPRRHSPAQLPPYSSRLLSSTARNASRPPLIQIEFSTRV